MTYLLGCDIGSGSCKTLLADENGRVVARASGVYALHYPHPNWAEYNPVDWYTAFCDTTRAVIAESGVAVSAIRAVCIIGITHNPVLLDAAGNVLRPSIHFNDQRSLAQCAALNQKWGGRILQRATNGMGTLWTYPQLAWIKENEPEIWRKTAALLFPKDYVRARLIGDFSPLTDVIDAAGTLLYDPVKQEWIGEFIEELGLNPAVLPQARQPVEQAGTVSKQGAADSGLKAGTPVLIGTTDTAAEMLAAGATHPGQGMLKLASVGRIAFIADQPARHPHILNYPYFEGLWYPGSAMKFAASAFRWLRESLWADVPNNSYEAMDKAAEAVPPGAEGLIFLPHLMGAFAPYWDAHIRGGFVGVGIGHHLGHFTRAVLEGVALGIRHAFEQATAQGFAADELFLIGNGARSPLWRQIMADVMGRALTVPQERDAAYGAVLLAHLGGSKIDTVRPLIQMETTSQPNPSHAALYTELFERYQKASDFMLTF